MIPGKQYTPADLLGLLRRRKWLVLLPFLMATLGTYLVVLQIPNRYRSETLILVVPQRVPESYVRSTVTARIEDRLQSISQQILSRTRLERIIEDLNLYEKERRTQIMEDIVNKMRKEIVPEVVKGDAFRISFTGDEPRTVMRVTERLASLFIEENLRDREVLAEGSYEFLDSQLEDARRRLKEHESKLEEYRRKYSGQLPTQVESNLQVIQNTQMQLQALNESMARDRDRRLVVERLLADASSAAPAVDAGGGQTPAGTVAQQLEQRRVELQQLLERIKPEHPDVKRLERTIAALEVKAIEEASEVQRSARVAAAAPRPPTAAEAARRNRMTELAGELENIDRQLVKKEAEEGRLRQVVAAYQARVEAIPTRESELIELTRDYDTLRGSYASLLAKKEDSKIAANLERRQIGEQFKVLDPARVPEKPYSPDRLRLSLMGALFGLGLGVGLAVLLELADSTFKTDEDVVTALALPVLATVPCIVTRNDRRRARRQRVLVAVAASVTAVAAVAGVIVWTLI